MPLPFKIDYLLTSGRVESERLEFKTGWNPLKVMHTLLKELDLTDERGTGIPKIMRAIKKNRSPEPRFETDAHRTFFTVTFPVHPKAKAAQAMADNTPPVTPPVAQLLELLASSGDMRNAKIRERFGLKDRAHLREHYVDPALAAGLIEMTIPDKPNSRLQKYRLTAKGRTYLQNQK